MFLEDSFQVGFDAFVPAEILGVIQLLLHRREGRHPGNLPVAHAGQLIVANEKAVLDGIHTGFDDALDSRVTRGMREGLTAAEIAEVAQRQLRIPKDSFLAATRDRNALLEVALDPAAGFLEGYLFPTTYTVPVGLGARDLTRVMAREFESRWRPGWNRRLDSMRMTRHEIVTLASIIEAGSSATIATWRKPKRAGSCSRCTATRRPMTRASRV